jgi:ribose transport system permease protein
MAKIENTAPAAANDGLLKGNPAFAWLRRNMASIVAVLALCLALSVTTTTFLVPTNLLSMLRQSSVNVLIAFGITCVLICGGIDLSVGSCAAASGVITVSMANAGFPLPICIATSLLFGAVLGLFNGYVVSHTTIPPFIVTLSTQIIVRGVGYVLTGGQPTQCTNEQFNLIGTGSLFGIPTTVYIIAVVFLILFFIINRTAFGRHVYATGGNPEAAKYAGINIKAVQMKVFMMSGILSALAGVVLAARLYSGQPSVGEGFERDAIAASVLGGTSFNGGIGTLGGTIIGAVIIGVLNNGMNLLKINSYWQFVVRGCVILGAVYIDYLKKARSLKK